MKVNVFIAFVALCFVFVNSQNIPVHLDRTATLSLSTDSSLLNQPGNSGTITEFTLERQCETLYIDITGASENNGFANAFTYFEITIASNNASSIEYTFNSGNIGEGITHCSIDDDCSPTLLGTDSSREDVFYCDVYEGPYYIEIITDCDEGLDGDFDELVSAIFFDLTVVQFEVPNTEMSSRSVTVGTVQPITNIEYGPDRYYHFHHTLETTVEENVAEGVLNIELSNFDALFTGETVVCVSTSNMIGNDRDLIAAGFDDDNNTGFFDDDCFMQCARGDEGAILQFNACSRCDDDSLELFIAVQLENANTGFDIDIYYRDISIPEIVTVTAANSQFSEQLIEDDDNCNGNIGFYGCNDYYNIDQSSFGANFGGSLGPFFRAEISGVSFGDVDATLTDGYLAGISDCCDDAIMRCIHDDDFGESGAHYECSMMLYPCQWNSNSDLYVTVEGTSQDFTNRYIDYNLNVEVINFPEIIINDLDASSNPLVDYNDNIRPGEYHHYTVSIGESNFSRGSQFYAELYANMDQDDVVFFWNRGTGNYAGFFRDCYSNLGMCRKYGREIRYQEDYDIYDDYADGGDDDDHSSTCRFTFNTCSYNSRKFADEVFSYNGDKVPYGFVDDDISGNPDGNAGLWVAELLADEYHFAVKGGYREDADDNSNSDSYDSYSSYSNYYQAAYFTRFNSNIDYTLTFGYENPIYLSAGILLSNTVYKGTFSPQYRFFIPNDPAYLFSSIQVSDVTEGVLSVFERCGDFAGVCPCYDYDRFCIANPDYYSIDDDDDDINSDRCHIDVPVCECGPESSVYVSIYADTVSIQNRYYYQDVQHPFLSVIDGDLLEPGYVLSVSYVTEVEEIESIEVGRQRSANSGVLKDIIGFDDYKNYYEYLDDIDEEADNEDIYKLDFINIPNGDLTPDDTLEITIVTQPMRDLYNNYGYHYGDDDTPDFPHVLAELSMNYPTTIANECAETLASCTAGTVNPLHSFYDDDIADHYWARYFKEFELSGAFSHCTIVVQSCAFNDGGACWDNYLMPQSSSLAMFNEEVIMNNDLFVTLTNIGPADAYQPGYYPAHDGVARYNIHTQIVRRSPIALTGGLTHRGQVGSNAYQHYSFVPSNTANTVSWLRATMWHQNNQKSILSFYMNYWEDSTTVVKAGETSDCFYHIFPCDVCTTNEFVPACYYQINPNDYATLNTGNFYFSVRNNEVSYFNQLADFNIKIEEMSVSDLNNGVAAADNIYNEQTAFYTFTTDKLSTNNEAIGVIYELDVNNVLNGYAYVTIEQESPVDNQRCRYSGDFISETHQTNDDDYGYYDDDENDAILWVRTPCNNVEGNTYYVTVEAKNGGAFSGDNLLLEQTYFPTSFNVHFKWSFIFRTDITLSTTDTEIGEVMNVVGTYNSANSTNFGSPSGPFSLSENEVRVFTWSLSQVNSRPGGFQSIRIAYDDVANQFFDDYSVDPGTITFYLNGCDYYFPGGDNNVYDDDDDAIFGGYIGANADNSDCNAFVSQCTVDDDNDCTFVLPITCGECDEWFITAYAENEFIPLDGFTKFFNIEIRVVNPYVADSVPSSNQDTTLFTSSAVTSVVDDDNNTGFIGFDGETAIEVNNLPGVNGGDFVTFSVSPNVNNFRVFTDTCDFVCDGNSECSIYACSNLSSSNYIVQYDVSSGTDTDVSLDIQYTLNDCPNCGTSITQIAINDLTATYTTTTPDDDADYYAYFQVNLPSSTLNERDSYTITSSLSTNQIFETDGSTPFFPGIDSNSHDYGFDDNDALYFGNDDNGNFRFCNAGNGCTCGAFTTSLPGDQQCCYEATTYTFAVVDRSTDFTFDVETFNDFQERRSVSINSGSSFSDNTGVVLEDQWVNLHFTVSTGNAFYYSLNLNDTAQVFMKQGDDRVDNVDDDSDFNYQCFGNDNIFNQIGSCSGDSNGDNACQGYFVPDCDICGDTTLITFAINAQDGDVDYNLRLLEINPVTQISSSISDVFPPTDISLVDDSTSTTTFGYYQYYQIPLTELSPENVFGNNFANTGFPFIPINNIIANGNEQRFQVRINNIRDITDSNNVFDVTSNPFDIDITTSNPVCGVGVTSICDSTNFQGNEFNCTINACDVISTCGTPELYLRIYSQNSNFDQYDFDVQIVSFFDDAFDDVHVDTLTIPSQSSGSTFTYTFNSNTTGSVATDPEVDFLVLFVNQAPQSIGTYYESRITNILGGCVRLVTADNLGTCSTFNTATGCVYCEDDDADFNGLNDDDNCGVLTSDMCNSFADSLIDNQMMYFVERTNGATGEAWQFSIDFDFYSRSDFLVQQTLQIGSTESYSQVHEIFEREIHSFDFYLPNVNGYQYLEINLATSCCMSDDDNNNIRFGFSFDDDTTSRDEYDFENLGFYPSSNSCNIRQQILGSDSSTTIFIDGCELNGGHYYISVFGEHNVQTYQDIPSLYEIEVTLYEIPRIELPLNCVYEQIGTGDNLAPFDYDFDDDLDLFDTNFEWNFEALSEGTEVLFIVDIFSTTNYFSGEEDDFNFYVAPNAYPSMPSSSCSYDNFDSSNNLDDDTFFGHQVFDCDRITSNVDNRYFEDDDSTFNWRCEINILPCEFKQGTWYGWLDVEVDDDSTVFVNVQASYDKKFVPQALLTNGNTQATWFNSVTADFYQFYKVIYDRTAPNFSPWAELVAAPHCDNSCTFYMYGLQGAAGYAAEDFALDDDFANQDDDSTTRDSDAFCYLNEDYLDCECYMQSCSVFDGTSCSFDLDYCNSLLDQSFIGVRKDSVFDDDNYDFYGATYFLDYDDDELDTNIDASFRTSCLYELNVYSSVEVTDLPIETEVCLFTECVDHYRIEVGENDFGFFLRNFGPHALHLYISSENVNTNSNCGNVGTVTDLGVFNADPTSYIENDFDFINNYYSLGTTCHDGIIYLTVEIEDQNNCNIQCNPAEYSLEFVTSPLDVTDFTVGGSTDISTDSALARLTVSASNNLRYFNPPAVVTDGICTIGNSMCNLGGDATDIYVVGSQTQFVEEVVATSLSVPSNSEIVGPSTSITYTGQPLYFSMAIPADVSSHQIFIDNFQTILPVDISDLYINFIDADDDTLCAPSCTGDDDADFATDSCGGTTGSFPARNECDSFGLVYFELGVCADICQDITFNLHVEFSYFGEVITGTTHEPFTNVQVPVDRCAAGAYSESRVIEVTNNLLAVNVNNLISVDATFSLNTLCDNSNPNSCTVSSYNFGDSPISLTSCNIEGNEPGLGVTDPYYTTDDDDFFLGCVPNDLYEFTITANAKRTSTLSSFDYTLITDYVPIINGVSSTSIWGQNTHYYSFANTGAVDLKITISEGPALRVILHSECPNTSDGENNGLTARDLFIKRKMCAHGDDCSFYIPYESSGVPSSTNYYLIIQSGSEDQQGLSPYYEGENNVIANVNINKPALYSIDLNTGANANTGVSSSFCSSTSIGSNTTWIYDSVAQKEQEVQCLYDQLVGPCENPDETCQAWLREMACRMTFETADPTTGFLQPLCTEVCEYTESLCGKFIQRQAGTPSEFNCYSGRYMSGSSNCRAIPTPAPIPDDDDEAFYPEEDEDNYLVVPDLPELYIYHPPIDVDIYLDDDGDIQNDDADNDDQDNDDADDDDFASSLTYSFTLILSALFVVFFF